MLRRNLTDDAISSHSFSQSLTPLAAFLWASTTGIASAQEIPIAEVFTYQLAGCISTGGGVLISFSTYNIPRGTCQNLPPNPNTPGVPFLAFKAGAGDRAAQTAGCELEIFSGTSCTGNAESFPIATGNLGARFAPCQDVTVTVGGGGVGIGGQSGRLVCG